MATAKHRFIEVRVPASFNDGEHAVLDHIEDVSESYATSRKVSEREVAVLANLVAEAAVPGGISQHEFARPGGWLERATAALASLVPEHAVPAAGSVSQPEYSSELQGLLDKNNLIRRIEAAGFSVSGPTDVRAAEHGEPAWVCDARAMIAELSVADQKLQQVMVDNTLRRLKKHGKPVQHSVSGFQLDRGEYLCDMQRMRELLGRGLVAKNAEGLYWLSDAGIAYLASLA